MGPKLENLDVNMSADEIGEYIDRFYFWFDTRETSDDEAIKGAFLTAVGKEAFTLLNTLVYPKTLRDASITEIQEALLRHVRPAQFEFVERAKFHTLIRNPNETLGFSRVLSNFPVKAFHAFMPRRPAACSRVEYQ